jgi:protein pelota
LAKISIIESTGTGGRVGIQEVLKKGTIERAATENRIAKEIRNVNEILEEIAKSSDLIAYGEKEVKEAANMGAIKKLLILDKLVSEKETLLDLVENMGGEIILISSEHEGGKQLEALGGIAALLRFKIH